MKRNKMHNFSLCYENSSEVKEVTHCKGNYVKRKLKMFVNNRENFLDCEECKNCLSRRIKQIKENREQKNFIICNKEMTFMFFTILLLLFQSHLHK